MTKLQLLLVEDQDAYIEQYEDVVQAYVTDRDRPVEMRVEKSIEGAKRSLGGAVDAAVVDLNLGKDTTDGGEVIDELKAHFRVPVAILTGTPGDADDQPPVVGVFTKGEHGFDDVLDRLWAVHEVGLTKIMGGRGLLEERLNKVFLNNLVPTIDVWIGYAAKDPGRTERALLRYALGHLVADLEGDETPCYPEEFYLDPPLNASLTTGSLLRKKQGAEGKQASDAEWCRVVMTPACDLVVRGDGRRKADSIVLATVVPEADLYTSLKANLGRQRRLRQNNDASRYHWMPQSRSLDAGFLDFGHLETVALHACEQEYECLGPRIAPSFIKDIVSRFSAFYARQGQPAIDDGAKT